MGHIRRLTCIFEEDLSTCVSLSNCVDRSKLNMPLDIRNSKSHWSILMASSLNGREGTNR